MKHSNATTNKQTLSNKQNKIKIDREASSYKQ